MGGAGAEMFYVDKMDKGVKKYVVDKDRKKDMLDSLKVADKGINHRVSSVEKCQIMLIENKNIPFIHRKIVFPFSF